MDSESLKNWLVNKFRLSQRLLADFRELRPNEVWKNGWETQLFNGNIEEYQHAILERLYSTNPFGISLDRKPSDITFSLEALKMSYLHFVFIYPILLLKAEKKDEKLTIIDFGGGIGNHFHILRSLVPFSEIDYFLVETSPNIQEAKKINGQIFSLLDIPQEIHCDFLHFGSSLQYIEKPFERLTTILSNSRPKYVLLSRTPIADSHSALRISSRAGISLHLFNKKDLIESFSVNGYRVFREFDSDETYKMRLKGKKDIQINHLNILFCRS